MLDSTDSQSVISVGGGGVVEKWFNTDNKSSWDFQVTETGEYDLILFSAAHHWQDAVTYVARVQIAKAGKQYLSLTALKINPEKNQGFRFRSIKLIPKSLNYMNNPENFSPAQRPHMEEMEEFNRKLETIQN